MWKCLWMKFVSKRTQRYLKKAECAFAWEHSQYHNSNLECLDKWCLPEHSDDSVLVWFFWPATLSMLTAFCSFVRWLFLAPAPDSSKLNGISRRAILFIDTIASLTTTKTSAELTIAPNVSTRSLVSSWHVPRIFTEIRKHRFQSTMTSRIVNEWRWIIDTWWNIY